MPIQRRGEQNLLTRLVEEPQLVALVQGLEGATLGRLIEHIGLEDAGEIVALATTAQLEEIFDQDLWRSQAVGQDETFDPDRFALWLEIMLEAGEEATARRLAELDEDLLTMAIGKQMLVMDVDALAAEIAGSENPDLADKALESTLSFELDRFQLVARHPESWDTVLTALVALDKDHHELLRRMLERCAFLAAEYIADNGGLYEVLTSSEMLETDVAGTREDRRARAGYVAPSAATAFLAWAQDTPGPQVLRADADPMTRAYFRAYQPKQRAAPVAAPVDRSIALFLDQLEGGQVTERRKLSAPETKRSAITDAMRALKARDAALYERQLAELNYLANVLIAGCRYRGRALRPVEAAEKVLALVEAGRQESGAELADHGAVKLFAIGWRVARERQLAVMEGIETAR
jgi:hypothetical protein